MVYDARTYLRNCAHGSLVILDVLDRFLDHRVVVVEDAEGQAVDEGEVGVLFRNNPVLAASGVEAEGSKVVEFLTTIGGLVVRVEKIVHWAVKKGVRGQRKTERTMADLIRIRSFFNLTVYLSRAHSENNQLTH